MAGFRFIRRKPGKPPLGRLPGLHTDGRQIRCRVLLRLGLAGLAGFAGLAGCYGVNPPLMPLFGQYLANRCRQAGAVHVLAWNGRHIGV